MRHRRLLALLALAAGALLAAPGAVAGDGFLAQQPMHRVGGTTETGARGGFTSWFQVRSDKTTVQGLRVWVTGLSDSSGATLWMSKPGDAQTQQVAAMAGSDNGSALWQVVVDSLAANKPTLPLGVASVLKLSGGVIEIRAPDANLTDAPVLRATVGTFDWRGLSIQVPGHSAPLRRPPLPATAPDTEASGFVRSWRKKVKGTAEQGIAVFAKGLTTDETYDIWIEDAGGTLVDVASLTTTSDGLGYFNLDTRTGDTLPGGIDVETVRDLSRRRVELRRSGFTDYSLAGLFPRVP